MPEEVKNFISPSELDDDPKRWLSVPHEMHESLLELMTVLFPEFKNKLKDVHCFECEGMKNVLAIDKDGTSIVINGYIGVKPNVMLHVLDG